MRVPSSVSRHTGDLSAVLPVIRPSFFVPIILAALLLAGCGIRLAPDYDRTIIDGLAQANEETMTLFATVASGAAKSTFPRRERTYDELIGKFDALRLESKVRPAPGAPLGTALVFGNNPAAQQKVADITAGPTNQALTAIMSTITAMRDADRKQGLQAIVVESFKAEYELSMQQVLTYEKQLQR